MVVEPTEVMSPEAVALLQCPLSAQPLELLHDHLATTSRALHPVVPGFHAARTGGDPTGSLATPDRRFVYPVLHGIPLLAPWWARTTDPSFRIDPERAAYAEAWSELHHYDDTARDVVPAADHPDVVRLQRLARTGRREPEDLVHARFDGIAEQAVYRFVLDDFTPDQRPLVQIGGTGRLAQGITVATGCHSFLLTPSLGEARAAIALAVAAGVAPLQPVVGLAELLPFKDEQFSRVVLGSSLHHVNLSDGGPEIARVLAEHGRLGTFEPWRARGYRIGTRLFGKRDPGVSCIPLDDERIEPLRACWPGVDVVRSGAYARYAFIVVGKLGATVKRPFLESVVRRVDDLARRLGTLDVDASSSAILWEKG